MWPRASDVRASGRSLETNDQIVCYEENLEGLLAVRAGGPRPDS